MYIYAVNIDNKLDDKLYMNFLSFIDDDKRTKINEFYCSNDKIRTLIGDILIRSIICDKLQIYNEEIVYEYNSYAKPKLRNNKKFHFNISHSGKWVVAAIDDQHIGIDIEKVCHMDYIGIAKRFFNNEEYNWLLAQNKGERLECFHKLWTLKESYIKMTGTGLITPLNSFTIVFNTKDNISIKDNNNLITEGYFKLYSIDNNYKMAVCSKNNNFTPKIKFMNYDELYKNIRTKY